MAKCELLEKCKFFIDKMGEMPEAATRVRNYYCFNHQERCARFIFFKVTGEGSRDLMPNDLEKLSERLGWGLRK